MKSTRFGTFIPLGYPTAEQRAKGFTGSDVGLHGPDRRFMWAGRANAWTDWTLGCVALAEDDAITRVGRFVRDRVVTTIRLE